MSDLQLLLLVLVVIYGWECTTWVRRGSVAFINFWGNRWRLVQPGVVVGNQHGGMVLANPLPVGQLALARQIPFSISPEAVFSHVAFGVNPGGRPAQMARCWRWDDIKKIEAAFKELRINGEPFLNTGSPVYTQHLATQLKELLKAPSTARADLIKKWHRAGFDTAALEKRWQEFSLRTKSLQLVTSSLFLFLFAVAPAAIWRFSLKDSWFGLLAALLALTTTAAILFRRRHLEWYPAAEDDRFTHVILTLFSPATSVRAVDVLSRPFLEAYHPLAAARVFCTAEDFREFARACWRDVAYPARPVCPTDAAPAVATEKFARELFRDELEKFLHRQKLSAEDLAQPPKPSDDNCRSYCPRCEAQFTTETGECADCGGMPLVAFALEKKSK